MKHSNRTIIFLLVIFATSCISTRKAPSEAFLEASQFHERIAILPFMVDFNEDYKQSLMQRNNKAQQKGYFEETSKFAGMDLQKALFQDMAKQVQKGRYEMVIQDFLTTNKGLEQADIPYRGLAVIDKGLLAKQLGVDALLFGTSFVDVNFRGFNQGGVTTKLMLYDAQSGQLLWESEVKQQASTYTDTPDRLASQTVAQLAKQLPYQKR